MAGIVLFRSDGPFNRRPRRRKGCTLIFCPCGTGCIAFGHRRVRPTKHGGNVTMRMKEMTLSVGLTAILLFATALHAGPVTVGIGGFGGATSIDFSSFVNDTLITTPFVGQGLTASR